MSNHPEIDAMLRNQQAGPTIAAPLNDIQLVALLGAVISASAREDVSPPRAIAAAIDLVAESIAQMKSGGLDRALHQARERVVLNDVVLLPTQ